MLHTIVVTYNAATYLDPCLASLAGAGRVIVVDNASTDATVEVIRRYPDYELIRSEKNLGYAGGTNLGLARALAEGADYVLILDQDARLFPDTADRLVAFAQAHPEYGVVSPVHLTAEQQMLEPHFRKYLLAEHPYSLDGAITGQKLPGHYRIKKLNSAIWLISRQCLETVGGFDPLYFQYSADMDYCYRLPYHDIKMAVIPAALAVHDRRKTLSDVEMQALEKTNSRQQFSYEATEIKKPHVSFGRELILAILRLLREVLSNTMHLHLRWSWVRLCTIGHLLLASPTIKRHQKICRTKGRHWLGCKDI